jgi:sulfonate transport system substrate-binding protein
MRAFNAALFAAVTIGLSAHADPVKIRAAWVTAPSSLIPILFAEPGVARHLGQSYTFEPTLIPSSSQQITAIAAGDVDLGTTNFAAFPNAVQNAGLTDLRIICDELQDGYEDHFSTRYMVRNDSGIKSVNDLKGKAVATNAIGSAADLGYQAELQKSGLRYPGDYTMIQVAFPNMSAVLLEGKVDVAPVILPFVLDPELNAKAHTLFAFKDAMGGVTELSVWMMRKPFMDANRAAVVDLLEDTVRAYRWYADPKNHTEAISIVAKFMKRPPEQMDWAFTKTDNYRNPDGVVNVAMLQHNVDVAQQFGFIKAPLDVTRYADMSLVQEAAARIK